MRKFFKALWIFSRSLLLFIFISYTIIVIIEHIQKTIKVENFKSKAIYQEQISSNKFKYYKIDYDGRETLRFKTGSYDCYPGNEGDILVSVEQNTVHPLVNGAISFYAGGHAGYIVGSYSDYFTSINTYQTIEATTTVGDNIHCAVYPLEDWTTNRFFNEVICLRVDMTDEERSRVNASVSSLLGDPYNMSFFFNTTNSNYCSDIISKGFMSIGKDLNKDGATTSIWDLIVSNDAYISYYHYFDSDGVKHIYYLG